MNTAKQWSSGARNTDFKISSTNNIEVMGHDGTSTKFVARNRCHVKLGTFWDLSLGSSSTSACDPRVASSGTLHKARTSTDKVRLGEPSGTSDPWEG